MATFRQDIKLGTKVPQLNGDDISDGSIGVDKLDSELRDMLDALKESDIAMSDLDLDMRRIKLCITGKLSSRMRVIGSVRNVAVPVGTLEMFSDMARRQLVQTLTTGYTLTPEGKVDGGLPKLGAVNRYRRYYDVRKMHWSEWVTDDTTESIDNKTIEDIVQSAMGGTKQSTNNIKNKQL